MRRIVIIGKNFPSGGAAVNYLKNLALALSKTSNVRVLIPSGYYYGAKNNKIRKGEICGIEYRYLCFKQHPQNYIGKLVDIVCSIFALFFYTLFNSRKMDIIMSYNISLFKTFSDILTSRLFRKKIVIILPEFYEKPSGFISKIKWYMFYVAIKYLTRYADGFIVFSEYLKDYLLKNRKINKPIVITPNAIDPLVFKIEKQEPYIKNGITIGYVGTPSRKDGIDDLLESFSIVNNKYIDTHLLVIGDSTDGSSSLVEQAKLIAKKMKVSDCVTFTGLVESNKVPLLLNSCQILILARPSGIFAEAGFPTKLGEYFSCRKPVVTTNVGDIGRYFRNKEHVILVEPNNPQSIAGGIEYLIENRESWNQLADNAYKWMDENINYRNINNKLEILLREV